jgi:signal peptidase I
MQPEIRSRPARILRALALLACASFAATWFVLLRPQFLGGPAAYVLTAGTSMRPTLSDGDLVVLRRAGAYRRGDVIAYRVPRGDPAAGSRVIHRIVGGSRSRGYVVKGDNKPYPDPWRPKPGDVIGSEWFVIPHVGTVFWLLRSPLVLASLAAGLAFGLLAVGRRATGDEDDAAAGHRTVG